MSQWESDDKVEEIFKLTVSNIAAVDVSDIASISVSDNAQTALRRSIEFARYLSDAAVFVTYSIYYTEDISQGSYPVYDDIVDKLSKSLKDGDFTMTLHTYAQSMNVTSMYNASCTSSGFGATSPEVVTNNNSSGNDSASSSSLVPIIAGVAAALVAICSGLFYYLYYRNKSQRTSAFVLHEVDKDGSKQQDSGDVLMYSMYPTSSSGAADDTASSNVRTESSTNPIYNNSFFKGNVLVHKSAVANSTPNSISEPMAYDAHDHGSNEDVYASSPYVGHAPPPPPPPPRTRVHRQ